MIILYYFVGAMAAAAQKQNDFIGMFCDGVIVCFLATNETIQDLIQSEQKSIYTPNLLKFIKGPGKNMEIILPDTMTVQPLSSTELEGVLRTKKHEEIAKSIGLTDAQITLLKQPIYSVKKYSRTHGKLEQYASNNQSADQPANEPKTSQPTDQPTNQTTNKQQPTATELFAASFDQCLFVEFPGGREKQSKKSKKGVNNNNNNNGSKRSSAKK